MKHTSKEQEALKEALAVWRELLGDRVVWRLTDGWMPSQRDAVRGGVMAGMFMRHQEVWNEFGRYERATRETLPPPAPRPVPPLEANTACNWMFLN